MNKRQREKNFKKYNKLSYINFILARGSHPEVLRKAHETHIRLMKTLKKIDWTGFETFSTFELPIVAVGKREKASITLLK